MVRFNDKTQISSLASNDIMPITDMSDTTDDRKVTVQQLSQFTVDNIPTLSGGKTLTDNNLTNTLKDNYDTAYENQDLTKYDSTVSYPKGYWVTGIVDDQKVVKESLIDGNLGNPLTDDTKWKDVALGGGGGGLEIGDIGIAPLGINEAENKRRYLNGQVIIADQYTSFAEKLDNTLLLYPNLAKTESEWQAISGNSVGGQCGYFVVDKTAGTIRLPKIIMPIQGLTDLSKLGDLVNAGLPNIEGSFSLRPSTENVVGGAFKLDSYNKESSGLAQGTAFTPLGYEGISFDASLSNPIYGNSDTVQQEQIQYPYFIQVATGVEESIPIINQLELNNPYTLLECKYSETILNNVSWLRSEGQWNSKAVYPKAYEALLVEQNPDITDGTTVELPSGTSYTKRGISGGISAKLSTESYTDEDFVVNTSDETFRLPIKTKYILPSDSNLYLYFYVGETVQNANLINAGRIEEKLVDCLTRGNKAEITGWGFPSDRYDDLELGASGDTYTAPADGYVIVGKVASSNQYIGVGVLKNNEDGVTADNILYYDGSWAPITGGVSVVIPIKKGKAYYVGYNANGDTVRFRFIYAEGAK